MDLHDIARGRGTAVKALARFAGPAMTASVTSDFLYPAHQQAEMARVLRAAGATCEHHTIDSVFGHDGFLVEHDKLGPMLVDFFDKVIVETT